MLDQHHLLIILLAEIGRMRLDDIEELGDDSGNTGKMSRTDLALKLPADVRHIDNRQHRARIHVRHLGREQKVDAGILEKRRIPLEIARITRQILVGAELQRIDENRHHGHVVFSLGA